MKPVAARFSAALTLAAFSAAASAADTAWEHNIVLYMIGAGLEGESQIGPVVTPIDAGFSDILESLEIGGMGAYSARKAPWTITFDAIFVALGAGDTGSLGASFDADVDQLLLSADLAYAWSGGFELLAGARYSSLDVQLGVTAPGGASAQAERDEDWIDPYVGARLTMPFGSSWKFVLRADVGGFGVGSDLAWNAVARVDWWLSDTLSLLLGYRVIDVDYETGSGLDRFRYDMATSGPAVGVSWQF